jgi:tetratricopeptide (TPR) repeat protein
MNLKRLFITTFISFFLFYTISCCFAGDDGTKPDAAQLEQTGRDYFAKGDFKQAIHYLELSRDEYENLGKKLDVAKANQNIGLAYLMTADFEQANLFLHKAEDQFVKIGDKERLAYCLNNLGLVRYYKGDYPAALDYYKKASELYKEVNQPEGYAELINRIGMTYWSLGINDKALEYLQKYITLLNPENPKSQAIGFNNLGAIYKEIGNTGKALEFFRKAADYYVKANDSLDVPSPLTNIGSIYYSNQEHDSALFFYNKSLIISDKMQDKLQSAKTKHNIALIYKDDKRYSESGDLLNEYLEMSKELGYKEGIAQAELSLGNLARAENKIEEAKKFYEDCVRDAGLIGLSNVVMLAHKSLSEILEEGHHYEEALLHFQQYMAVKDTILTKEKARIITELETRYETEKKEQENILLIKDNELKDKTINTLYLLLAGILILAVSLVFLVILYRRNALTKKRLADSEAARLAEKVDFQNRELASNALALSRNLSFIKNLLTELKELTPHVDTVGLQTVRSISRSIQHLDNDPAWEEFEMRFHQVHNKFYENLMQSYPSLTTNEVRLCALLKLGMNTKEISSVTFQNIRAIEAARLRLRKKLCLEGADDLGAFLQKF